MNTLRLESVSKKLDIAESTVRKLSKEDPLFPKPFKLSAGITVWDNTELDSWIAIKKGDRHGT
jgi:predicted DNA-binding transcriptional regulator AlpA